MLLRLVMGLAHLLLRRVRKVPVWLWIFLVAVLCVVPNAMGFWFGLEVPGPLVILGGIAGLIALVAYCFGFRFDYDYMGTPANERHPRV